MDILIPFSGFYNTLWSDEIERQVEQMAEHLREEEFPGLDLAKITEILSDNTNYREAYEHVARVYVEEFGNWLSEKCGWFVPPLDKDGCGRPVEFKFDGMTSPKYYNFETDRLFAKITYEEAHALVKKAGWPAICEQAKRHFTSRDGFHSWYSPNPAEWGKLREWDHNQLSMVLYALMDYETDMQIYYGMDEEFYRAFGGALDWDKAREELEAAREELEAAREELEAAQEEWDAETNPNGLSFPEFSRTPSMEAYVKAFEAQNGLKGEQK